MHHDKGGSVDEYFDLDGLLRFACQDVSLWWHIAFYTSNPEAGTETTIQYLAYHIS
jgi:hypothetical protein